MMRSMGIVEDTSCGYRWWLALWSVVALCTGVACAQVGQDEGATDSVDPVVAMQPPPLAGALQRLLDSGMLDEAQQRELRLEHGLWTLEDVRSVADRSRVALVDGRLDDRVFADADAPVLDRAEAAIERGEMDVGLGLLSGQSSTRAVVLRATALEGLGAFERARAALEPLVERLSSKPIDDADELAWSVRGLMIRSRLQGPERKGGAQADAAVLMQLLARARDDLDRLAWRARLTEARLLVMRDNRPQAVEALTEVLSLNPRCHQAWAMLGQLAVDSFDFDRAEAIALQLDDLCPGSLDASVIRARAALRKRDASLAAALLDEALERYPVDRQALAWRAAAAGAAFDFDDMQHRLDAMDQLNATQSRQALGKGVELHTASPAGYLAAGRVLAENRQYDKASAQLNEAASRQPRAPDAWIALGLLELQAGRDMRARDALERALALDPFNVGATNSLSVVTMLNGFERLESEHFVVRYRAGIDRVLAQEMVPVLEGIYGRVCGRAMFDYPLHEKTTIELMPDHASFAVRISGMPAIHTMAASTGPVIAMETPREGAGHRIGPYDWPRTVQHEFIHTVTLSRTRNRIPHWLTEAAAVWGESRGWADRVMLNDAESHGAGAVPESWWPLLAKAYVDGTLFDMDTISLRFVRPETPTDRTQAYAQGWWMYRYMVERWGNEAPLKLMDLYAQGVGEDDAMSSVLGLDGDAFFAAFKDWAGDELVALGLVEPEGTPDLATMLGSDPAKADEATISRALEAYPDDPALLALAVSRHLHATSGVVDDALVPMLERLVKVRPTDLSSRRLLVQYLLGMERGGEVLTEHQTHMLIESLEALDADASHSPAYAVELAQRYAKAGSFDRAWAKVLRATHIGPFDPTVREEAARIALLRGRLDDARHQIEVLTELEPDRAIHRRRLKAIEAKMKP